MVVTNILLNLYVSAPAALVLSMTTFYVGMLHVTKAPKDY